jgi:hypothetical protein
MSGFKEKIPDPWEDRGQLEVNLGLLTTKRPLREVSGLALGFSAILTSAMPGSVLLIKVHIGRKSKLNRRVVWGFCSIPINGYIEPF